jgi:monolysocardiolipin acyltransferase
VSTKIQTDLTAGFDQVMPEPRNFPRFLPRPGGSISINFGPPLTPRIRPLVEAWKDIASKQSGTVGVGGRWEEPSPSGPSGETQRLIRSQGRLADGQEEAVRIEITQALQEGVRELGEQVEREEGRYERGEWCQSRRRIQ